MRGTESQNGDFCPIYRTYPLYPGIRVSAGTRGCPDVKGPPIVPPNRLARFKAMYRGSRCNTSKSAPIGLYIMRPAGANHLSSRGGSGTYIFIPPKAPIIWCAKANASGSFWITTAISVICPLSAVSACFWSSVKTRWARFWTSRSNSRRKRAASALAVAAVACALAISACAMTRSAFALAVSSSTTLVRQSDWSSRMEVVRHCNKRKAIVAHAPMAVITPPAKTPFQEIGYQYSAHSNSDGSTATSVESLWFFTAMTIVISAPVLLLAFVGISLWRWRR